MIRSQAPGESREREVRALGRVKSMLGRRALSSVPPLPPRHHVVRCVRDCVPLAPVVLSLSFPILIHHNRRLVFLSYRTLTIHPAEPSACIRDPTAKPNTARELNIHIEAGSKRRVERERERNWLSTITKLSASLITGFQFPDCTFSVQPRTASKAASSGLTNFRCITARFSG